MPEIELKFALDPADGPRLRRSAALAGAKPAHARVLALYFDTPEATLASRGLALRLRRARGRWSQALKDSGSARGGLHQRNEWEADRPGPRLDLALLAGTPLAALEGVETLHERLVEVFRVQYERTAWRLEPSPGARVEVALDMGHVQAKGREEALSEVEIECLAGPAAAAFDVAAALLEEVALRPSVVTKAARGYRLARGAPRRPVKALAPALRPDMTAAAAARAMIAAALEQLQANEEGLLLDADPEFVHQARVAMRRMRSVLRMFRDALGVERAEAWRAALAGLAGALGEARDRDVFATETLPPIAAAFGDAALARRLRSRASRARRPAREAARAAIAAPGHGRVMLALARWLHEDEAPDVPGVPVAPFAARVLRKRHRRLLEHARRLAQMTPQERHAVRIDAKRLRYAVDGLASLFHEKRARRYAGTLAELQDALGRANDAATALRLLPELGAPEAFIAFARGWLAARSDPDAALLDALVARLHDGRRFRPKREGGAPAAP